MKFMAEEEKEEIINMAVERALSDVPETVGHLITTHMEHVKINREFYSEHPEFEG